MISEIYTAMRKVAMQGGNAAAIVAEMKRREKCLSKIQTILYFCDTFKISISQSRPLIEWNGLNNGLGLSDEEIDQIFMPLIRKDLGMEEWTEAS